MKKVFKNILNKVKKGIKACSICSRFSFLKTFLNKKKLIKHKKKIIALFVVISLILISFFIGYRIGLYREVPKDPPDELILEQKSELDIIKKERGYTPPTEAEIQYQIQELRTLREQAKEAQKE